MIDLILGIDLGTTNSAVAILDGDAPRLIPNALGEFLTPSVVGIDLDGQVVVGRTAQELMVTHPERCASQFKRKMGTDALFKLAGTSYSPETLSSLVLRSLMQDAEAHLGRPIDRAVVTVPAYFNDLQRKSTIRAGQIARLKIERIINEPTAAALAYGLRDPLTERLLLVFDLGGGTFDVSIVDVMESAIEIRASAGEGFLGGEDFTQCVASRVLQRQGLSFERVEMESPLRISRLLQQAEVAKRRLAREAAVSIRLPDRDGRVDASVPVETITQEDFRAWTESLLSRIELPMRRALGDARLNRTDITDVILVGGATRMPAVVKRVTEMFGKPPLCSINPDEVVALGAAVQAGLIGRQAVLDDLVVTDVAPFSLGVETVKTFGTEHREGYFYPIIERNTTIPVSRCRTVATIYPNQTEINIHVYQGESRRVADDLLIGQFTVPGIPRGPAGQEVEIRFTYDLNGILEVEATVVATRAKHTHIVTRHASEMSPADIARAVKAMAALKTHPREESANRLTLRRAERLYGEVSSDERAILSQFLDGFEAALELGDKEAIVRHREALMAFLESIDPSAFDDEPGDDDGTR